MGVDNVDITSSFFDRVLGKSFHLLSDQQLIRSPKNSFFQEREKILHTLNKGLQIDIQSSGSGCCITAGLTYTQPKNKSKPTIPAVPSSSSLYTSLHTSRFGFNSSLSVLGESFNTLITNGYFDINKNLGVDYNICKDGSQTSGDATIEAIVMPQVTLYHTIATSSSSNVQHSNKAVFILPDKHHVVNVGMRPQGTGRVVSVSLGKKERKKSEKKSSHCTSNEVHNDDLYWYDGIDSDLPTSSSNRHSLNSAPHMGLLEHSTAASRTAPTPLAAAMAIDTTNPVQPKEALILPQVKADFGASHTYQGDNLLAVQWHQSWTRDEKFKTTATFSNQTKKANFEARIAMQPTFQLAGDVCFGTSIKSNIKSSNNDGGLKRDTNDNQVDGVLVPSGPIDKNENRNVFLDQVGVKLTWKFSDVLSPRYNVVLESRYSSSAGELQHIIKVKKKVGGRLHDTISLDAAVRIGKQMKMEFELDIPL